MDTRHRRTTLPCILLLIFVRIKWGWKAAIALNFSRTFWLVFIRSDRFQIYRLFKIPAVESSIGTWFLWAAGALAVEYAYGLIKLPKWTTNFSIGFVCLIISAFWYVYGFVALVNADSMLTKVWWFTSQPMWGVTFFFLMNWFVSLENRDLQNWQIKLLKIGAWFGIFSYSIYLMCEFVVRISPQTHWLLRAFLTIVVAYSFHRLFERPFMNKSYLSQVNKYESSTPLQEAKAV